MKHIFMKTIAFMFIMMFVMPYAALFSQSKDDVTIYAYRTYQKDNQTDYLAGPIHLNASNPTNVTLIDDQTSLGRIYAGTYFNYKWYATTTKAGTQSTTEDWVTIDLETGARTKLASIAGSSQLHGMSYDYSTGKMIGMRTTSSSGTYFYSINLETGALTPFPNATNSIGDMYFLAFAIDYSGQFYGIDMLDNLYRINKTNLSCELVGNTGVYVAFTQSMGFDYNSGTLYWANSGDAHLYTVNTTTGLATDLGYIGQGDDMMSMFVKFINVPAGAPDRVVNVNIQPDLGGATSAVISWKNPSITAQENPLTSLTGIKIYRDDVLVQTITSGVTIGQNMSWTDNTSFGLTPGQHTYKIIPYNAAGDGGCEKSFNTFIGYDAPGPVNNLTLSAVGQNGLLTWSAPTVAMHGGAYNPADLQKYVVKRNNANPVELPATATQYLDETITTWGWYSYEIYAVNSKGNGTVVTSASVLLHAEGMVIMQNGTFNVCSGTFYDTGGPTGLYANNENIIMTLKPETEGAKLCAKFTSFETEEGYDLLYVYNSETTDPNALVGTFSGESGVPSALLELIATNPAGALTFHFKSDVMGRLDGWSADISCVIPMQKDLRAITMSGAELPAVEGNYPYTVVIRNEGIDNVAGNDYKVQIRDDSNNVLAEASGVNINAWETKTVIVNWTPIEEGPMNIFGYVNYTADLKPENNITPAFPVNVQPKGTAVITIGNHEGQQVTIIPINFVYNNSICETVYPAGFFGTARGNISNISYEASIGSSGINVPIRIWMKEIEETNLANGWIYPENMTLVFDATVPFPVGEYTKNFTLQTPFPYTGGNLVVMIEKENDTYTFNEMFWVTRSEDINTTLVYASDNPIDPNNPNNPVNNNWYWFPDTRFIIQPECEAPTNVTVTMSYDGSCGALITWDAPINGTKYNVYRDNILIASNITTTSCTDNDFSLGTHTWCVKTVCGSDESPAGCATATCTVPTFTIAASATTGGVINPQGDISVVYDGSRTFTFTANLGYELKEVLVDGANVPEAVAAKSYTFNNVTANHTIQAVFERIKYIIMATAEENGTIDPMGEVEVSHGDSKTFTITADPGYAIENVLIDGVNNPAAVRNGSYTFSNVTAPHTISATFVQAQYTITATAGAGGSITPSGIVGAAHGDTKTFFIVPNAGYKITQVLVDGIPNQEAMSGSYTFYNIATSHTISATFEYSYSVITATAGEGGTVTPAGVTQVLYGQSQYYTITPHFGYKIATVVVDGSNNAAAVENGSYLFVNVTSDHSIAATFERIPHTIISEAGTGGSISPSGSTQVADGGTQTYTITVKEGYTLTKVLVDGTNNETAVAAKTYTFSNVTGNHTIRAFFEISKYTIEATAGENGTIAPTGTITINYGGSKTYTFAPNAGYVIDKVLIDGTNNATAVTEGTYSFEDVKDNHTIEVSFKVTTSTITATVEGGNGTIDPEGETTVDYGASQIYTFTPNEGYDIAEVLVDGVSKPGAVQNGSYTFNNVTTDHEIIVKFSEKTAIDEGEMATLKVYPNPTSGQLRITNYELKIENVLVFDITGRLVMEVNNIDNNEANIDLSNYADGVYFINVDEKTVKVVKR